MEGGRGVRGGVRVGRRRRLAAAVALAAAAAGAAGAEGGVGVPCGVGVGDMHDNVCGAQHVRERAALLLKRSLALGERGVGVLIKVVQ